MLADISYITPILDRMNREEAKRRRLEKDRTQKVLPPRQGPGAQDQDDANSQPKGRSLNAYA